MRRLVLSLVILATVAVGCSSENSALLVEASGGDTTTRGAGSSAFGVPAPNLDTLERRRFETGDVFFSQPWIPAGTSGDTRDGLGPLFNATSCASCHVLDGRGAPPSTPGDPERGLLLRTGIPDGDDVERHPVFGIQIQDRSIDGVPTEAHMVIEYKELTGTYDDGTSYTLRSPTYGLADPAYGDSDGIVISPRIAPAIFGLGLLEAIDETDLLANVDPDDADGDGISGRAPSVWSSAHGATTIGRIGWKASVATVLDQVAGAFFEDLGVTSHLHPNENCSEPQTECRAAPTGGSPELSADRLSDVVFYSSTLGVPQRRNLDDPSVAAGADLFLSLGCAACHTPTFTTGSHAIPALSNQVIFPFTDLLLHDMGPGLADAAPGDITTASEWRTPPLWGLGLIETVNGHTYLLHDGRARTIEEAILWHGGEAAASQQAFVKLDAADRIRVIAFLESL